MADYLISSQAEYRRDHYIFPREQSPALKQMEWEVRAPAPIQESWLKLLYEGLVVIAFMFMCFMLADALKGVL